MLLKDWLVGFDYTLVSGSLDVEVDEVVYDSRKVRERTVFVCMQGTKIDSHDFIEQVVNDGVGALVVEKEVVIPKGVTAIRVGNAREALAYLSAARFNYPAKKLITIGVTGTKGKTTTTHMIKAILEKAGKKAGMIGTTGIVILNQNIPTVNTTPESYELHETFDRMVKAGCEYVIMEVSSQGTKMHRTDGILFDYAVFNNISPDHIGPDEHADFEEYLSCKAMLFAQSKVGVFNLDDVHTDEIVKRATCKSVYFSLEQSAHYMAKKIEYLSEHDFVGLQFLVTGDVEFLAKVNIPGKFNVSNALAAISVCHLMDVPMDAITTGLEHIYVNGRMEIVYASKKCSVIVDYAHNAVSMESLLTTLREYQPRRLVCVFGCGGNRSKDRRYSMGEIGGRLADLCIITADNSRFEKVEDILNDIKSHLEPTGGEYIEIPDRREAIEYSILNTKEGDMIAIIGKGHEDYQEVEGVRYPFLDRAVVEETIKKL